MTHTAIVAKIDAVTPIMVKDKTTGEMVPADSIHLATVLGEQVVVSKDWGVGYIGILFPVDLQLSEEFCYQNSLYRAWQENKDTNKKGFFEESRRVRAQPFLGVKSTGFFTTLGSVEYTGVVLEGVLGFTFTELNGKEICQKYISEAAKKQIAAAKKEGKVRKADSFPDFAKHVDSEQFKHYVQTIPEGAILSFHHKVHGTSFRVGYLPEVVPLNGFKKLVNKVLPVFPETKKSYVVGTRNVVLNDPEKEGFHGSEAFRFHVLEALKPYMEYGMTIYGEIAGFVNGKPIMPDHDVTALKDKRYTDKYGKTITYSYGCKEHEIRFHIYRITRLTVGGETIEMSQQELDAWCDQRDLLGPLEVFPKIVYLGEQPQLVDLVEELTERPSSLTEDVINPAQISEGIIIRIEHGGKTKFLKNKSYAFKCMEGICEVDDTETLS